MDSNKILYILKIASAIFNWTSHFLFLGCCYWPILIIQCIIKKKKVLDCMFLFSLLLLTQNLVFCVFIINQISVALWLIKYTGIVHTLGQFLFSMMLNEGFVASIFCVYCTLYQRLMRWNWWIDVWSLLLPKCSSFVLVFSMFGSSKLGYLWETLTLFWFFGRRLRSPFSGEEASQ